MQIFRMNCRGLNFQKNQMRPEITLILLPSKCIYLLLKSKGLECPQKKSLLWILLIIHKNHELFDWTGFSAYPEFFLPFEMKRLTKSTVKTRSAVTNAAM